MFRLCPHAQAFMTFEYPMVDNSMAFSGNNYDTALLRKNKVASCVQNNLSFYFDTNGRLQKSILIPQDSATQVYTYIYDSKGDRISTEMTSPNYKQPHIITNHKTYMAGLLMKDSSNSNSWYLCKHFEYYADGSLRQELWFGFDHRYNTPHRLIRGFWFGVDSAGRTNRIIDRNYSNTLDSLGQLVSNRTLIYNEKNQLLREEEAVKEKDNIQKSLFCPNAGSADFLYDYAGRLVEIKRSEGPSQKIKYLPNGLIAEIQTSGKNCEGEPYQWRLVYTYTYRN